MSYEILNERAVTSSPQKPPLNFHSLHNNCIFASTNPLKNFAIGTEGIQDKYVNPYTDFGFKLLFGTVMNKELLISFLNALLFGEETVKDVTYLNTEHLGTQEYDRRAIFDVYCENEKGEKFLVEMQRGEQQFL